MRKVINGISQVICVLISLFLFSYCIVMFIQGEIYTHWINSSTAKKPVIYVYNDTDDKTISLTLNKNDSDEINIVYPRFAENNTWVMTADKNSNIVIDDRHYRYLYWEDEYGIDDFEFTEGFCVKSENTVKFLEQALSEIGLNETEQTDFITYWLPSLVKNKYNIIAFNPDCYRETYSLTSSVNKIDNIITAFMIFKASDDFIDIVPQDLSKLNNKDRTGLVITEWGGTDYDLRKLCS